MWFFLVALIGFEGIFRDEQCGRGVLFGTSFGPRRALFWFLGSRGKEVGDGRFWKQKVSDGDRRKLGGYIKKQNE